MDRSEEYKEALSYINEQIVLLEKDIPENKDGIADYHRGLIEGLRMAHISLSIFYSKKMLQEMNGK